LCSPRLATCDALNGNADLSAIHKGGEGGAASRDLQGCLGRDHERVVAGGFDQTALDLIRAGSGDAASGLGRTGNGNRVSIGNFYQ